MNIWITGKTRSGKTTRLVEEFASLVKTSQKQQNNRLKTLTPAILVLAPNDENRRKLSEKLANCLLGSYPIVCKTPIGFICDEVMLFWPILFEKLNLKAQFPLMLRPETEQELATRLWGARLNKEELSISGGEARFVRRTLDLLQLAGASTTRAEEIATFLEKAFPGQENLNNNPQLIGELIISWRTWCLERGLLTYGIVYDLYWRYLLTEKTYLHHLHRRYQAIFADDMDDYPAVVRDLAEILLAQSAKGVFTFNLDGQVRLGLNADPNYILGLSSLCQVENLPNQNGLAAQIAPQVIDLVTQTSPNITLTHQIKSIQTISRAQLLRTTAEVIINAVKNHIVKPEEVAIIAPGLDEIGRYSLIEILTHEGIPVKPLNEQRSLISYPLVRAMLTLLALIYPGLGNLLDAEAIAEMLVILTRKPKDSQEKGNLIADIDLVRAQILADHCCHLDPQNPKLLPSENYPRWDRLGYKTTTAYESIRLWIEETRSRQQGNNSNPLMILDLAIKKFVASNYLPYDQLEALRELTQTTQHFWDVARRLKQNEPSFLNPGATLFQFILLLRRGTITANSRPMSSLKGDPKAITLATIYQYRALRSTHRWQFWLDTSSPLWDKGGSASLFAAPIFWRDWDGDAWTPEAEMTLHEAAKLRILQDLLGRCQEQVFLCHSDLAVNGAEQAGSLAALVYASSQLNLEPNILTPSVAEIPVGGA